jgi:hypothetical protein
MITTFDNKQWNKQELIDNMYDDSFYYNYLGKNALSSSSAKMLIVHLKHINTLHNMVQMKAKH